VYQFLQCENNRYQTDFESLYQSALEKVKDHVTDLAEIQRVLGKK
jgi:protein transport protein HofB